MRVGSFGDRAAISMLGLAVLLVVLLFGTRLYIASVTDGRVADRERMQVSNGMRGWVSEVEGRVEGQTTWDEAVKNLAVKYDPAWAHKNVGQFFHDMLGLERAFVLDAANRPIYAMDFGRDAPPKAYAKVSAVAAPLVAKVRRIEVGLAHATRAGTGPFKLPPPVQSSTFALVDGQPNIVTATLIQPDFNTVHFAGKSPVVVTTEVIDAALLDKFARRFLLEDLHILPGARHPSHAHQTWIDLGASNGRPVARLAWEPQEPNFRVFARTTPVLLAAVLFFYGVAAILFMRGRAAVQALVASETQSKHLAYHDHLTGLPNRAMFSMRMEQALAELRRSGRSIGILALDLDRFKLINDNHGHGAGDELIVQIAFRLKAICRATDTVVRLGGDEFAIIHGEANPRGLATFAERVVEGLSGPVELSFGQVFTGVSVGVTLVTDPNTDGEEALRQADLAMYRAKDAGRGRFEFYEPEMDLALKARRALELDLREALRTEALTMAYQPQIDGGGGVVGVEALVRWVHPKRGAISPAFFVAVAEECGLIDLLGEFTLRRAFADSLRWPQLRVAVNVSARQLRNGNLVSLAARVLRETRADPRRIELEITEGVLLEDDESTRKTLERLRAMGFSLALDDFGTGYSSLSYLRRYPVDKIKIDRSFVTDLGAEKESEAVVSAIVRLARALNLQVIAEGVETEAQRLCLKRAGCSDVQGFLYSQPIPADDVAPFVDARPAIELKFKGKVHTPT